MAAHSRPSTDRRTSRIITGFYVPLGTPPAAETDGPVGAALLAGGLRRLGIACRVRHRRSHATRRARPRCAVPHAALDVTCRSVVRGSMTRSRSGGSWRHTRGVDRTMRPQCRWRPRNMRGEDISAFTTPLDELFLAGPWQRIAIGDGGNEIGMGSVPASVIGAHVAHGEKIACVTPATHLIVAGVSNWGAYALIGGLAVRDRSGARHCSLVLIPNWIDIFSRSLSAMGQQWTG